MKTKLEIKYKSPEAFKDIFNIYQVCTKGQIYLQFTREQFVISALDHCEKIHIYTIMRPKIFDKYKVPLEPYVFSVNAEAIYESFKIINKGFGYVKMYVKHKRSNRLYVELEEKKSNSRDKNYIEMLAEIPRDLSRLDNDYQLSATLFTNHYKSRLSSYNKKFPFCEISYQKRKIKFKYLTKEMTLGKVTSYRDNQIIDLKSSLDDISCTINASHIICLFKKMISNVFTIYISNGLEPCYEFQKPDNIFVRAYVSRDL